MVLVAAACAGDDTAGAPTEGDAPTVAIDEGVLGTTGVVVAPGPTAPTTTVDNEPTIDWSSEPVVFFSPLPPLPPDSDLPFAHGSDDYLDLFEPGAPWSEAAERVDVFKIPTTWVRHYSSDDDLRALISGLDRLGIALGVEAGPLPGPSPDECVGGEGYGGVYEVDLIRRIHRLGGTVAVVALDEPFAFGHRADGPDDCQRPLDRVAREVADFVARVETINPDVVVGDIEPMWAQPLIGADDMAAWLDAYETAAGEPFGFLHLDSEWSRPDWTQTLLDVTAVARTSGVPVGVIYNGGEAGSDEEWIENAARRMYEYEVLAGGTLDHVVIQSWNDRPHRTLPDTDVTAMTSLVNRYFGIRPVLTLETDGAAVRAVLREPAGSGIGGATVDVAATPLDGVAQEWTLAGSVPSGIDRALIQIAVNDGGRVGPADLVVTEIRLIEGETDRLVNGAFAGLEGWGPYGDGSATASDTGLRLTAAADEQVFVDSQGFPVGPGAEYVVIVVGEVPIDSAGLARVNLIFLGADGVETERTSLVLSPAPVTFGEGVTDAAGAATIPTTGLAPGRHLVRATAPGGLDRWTAYVELEVAIP